MSILEQYGIDVKTVKEKIGERFSGNIVLTRASSYLSSDGHLITLKTSNNDLPIDQIAVAAERELGLNRKDIDVDGAYLYVREL